MGSKKEVSSEQTAVSKLMLLGIGTVFLSVGLANMPKRERKKLALQMGVPEDEVIPIALGLLLPLIDKQVGKQIKQRQEYIKSKYEEGQ